MFWFLITTRGLSTATMTAVFDGMVPVKAVDTVPESMLIMARISAHQAGVNAHLGSEFVVTLLRNRCSP
jgi:hypothetical protein